MVKAAASIAILRVSKSKSIFITVVDVVLIAPIIMMHAAVCKHCSSILVEATFVLLHHITVTYSVEQKSLDRFARVKKT